MTVEEYEQISSLAKQTGLSISTFIRRVCLGQKVESQTDREAMLAVMKANSDLGRLGGLLKFALTGQASTGMMAFDYRKTLHQIEKSQAEVTTACRKIVYMMQKKKKSGKALPVLALD